MKRFLAVSVVLVASIFALGYSAYGHGPGRGGPLHFDAKSLKTFTGTVVSTGTEPGFGRFAVSVLAIEAEGKKTLVRLGPSWYLARQNFSAKVGDTASVVGVPVAGQSFIVAKSVTVGGKTLVLRDEAGLPAWRGAGHGGQPCGGMMGGGGMGPRGGMMGNGGGMMGGGGGMMGAGAGPGPLK